MFLWDGMEVEKGVDTFMHVCRGGVYFTMKEHKKFVGG